MFTKSADVESFDVVPNPPLEDKLAAEKAKKDALKKNIAPHE